MFKKLHGDTDEADTSSRGQWLEKKWAELQEEYTEENIWNADESGIYF